MQAIIQKYNNWMNIMYQNGWRTIDIFIHANNINNLLSVSQLSWKILYKVNGWKSFKVYHIGRKGLNLYCSPFLPYILIPIKNNESKVVIFFKGLYFKLLQLWIPS